MRRTKEEAAQTRQDLLAAALTVFSQKGYEAARLEDIAEMAGVTRGAIYFHFGNKAGLFMALVEDASALGAQAIDKAVQGGGTFTEITGRILVNTLSLLEDDRSFREVMALSLSVRESSPELADFSHRRSEEALSLVANISSFFQMGISQGDLRLDLDPLMAARALLAYQNGLAMLWLANPDAFSIKESAPAFADLFLSGVLV